MCAEVWCTTGDNVTPVPSRGTGRDKNFAPPQQQGSIGAALFDSSESPPTRLHVRLLDTLPPGVEKDWQSCGTGEDYSHLTCNTPNTFSEQGRDALCRHNLIRQQRVHECNLITDASDPMESPRLHTVTKLDPQFQSCRDLSAFMR